MASRQVRLHLTAVLLAGAAALSGCTGSSAPTPTPSQESTSPSPTPSLTAAQQLQQLAALGTKAVYRATYLVRQKHPSSKATWQVWRTRASLRLDVATKHATATLIRTPRHTFACSRSGHKKRCFRVTKGGSLPAPLRLLAAQLFSADVATMAKASAVTVGAATSAGRFGTCFDVAPRNHHSTLEKANYCFNAAGVLTRVRYRNGNFVQAQHISAQRPNASAFHPYASPTPIPG